MSKNVLIVILTMLSICKNLYAEDFFTNLQPIKIEPFQIIDQKLHVRGYPQLQFGEENYFLFAHTHNAGNITMGHVASIVVKDGQMVVGSDIVGNLNNYNYSDWTDEPCKREDFLWKRNIGGKYKNINCATINHWVDYLKDSKGDYQQVLVYLKDKKIEPPPTIIVVTFTRYSDNGKWLEYKAGINPEYFGIKRDSTSPWGSNSWHKSFINRDPKKVEFLQSLIKWTEAVQDKMDLAFAKKSDAFIGLAPLESFFTIAPKILIAKQSDEENKIQKDLNAQQNKTAEIPNIQTKQIKNFEEAFAKEQKEMKLAKEAQAREVAVSEAKEKAQQELRLSQEAQAREAALAKLKEEEYEREKQSAAAKARVLEEIKAEAYAKEKAILEAKAKAQADLKAEEIAKKKAEEQAKAQAIIDEKNRVAAAKAAEAQAKKDRELEIAEEKRKIAESQKKLEVLKNKPLVIDNSTVANQSKSETSNKKTRIPIFTLACGAMGGQPLYRIVSNGSDIFFGSERNINDAQKGYEIEVTERRIKFKLKSGSETYGMPEPQMELYRDILSAFSKQFVDKSIYPPDGIHTVSYKCQTIEDDNIFNTLKNAYESRSAETKKKKQEYDNRPNKI